MPSTKTFLRVTTSLKTTIRTAAVRNHMPMTKLIELAVAKMDEKPKRSPLVFPAPARVTKGKRLKAMHHLAATLADAISVEQADNGMEYVSLAFGQFSLVLTPERRRDGTVDCILCTDTGFVDLGHVS